MKEWHLYVAFEMGGIDTVSHFFSGYSRMVITCVLGVWHLVLCGCLIIH